MLSVINNSVYEYITLCPLFMVEYGTMLVIALLPVYILKYDPLNNNCTVAQWHAY